MSEKHMVCGHMDRLGQKRNLHKYVKAVMISSVHICIQLLASSYVISCIVAKCIHGFITEHIHVHTCMKYGSGFIQSVQILNSY